MQGLDPLHEPCNRGFPHKGGLRGSIPVYGYVTHFWTEVHPHKGGLRGDYPPYMNFMCTRDAGAGPFTLICFGGLKLHFKYSSYVFQYVCVLIILYLEVFFYIFIFYRYV